MCFLKTYDTELRCPRQGIEGTAKSISPTYHRQGAHSVLNKPLSERNSAIHSIVYMDIFLLAGWGLK